MQENKQIVINKTLHKRLKSYCADNDKQMKEYTEEIIEAAIGEMSLEEMKEKQYRDSFASTDAGGPMIRYSGGAAPENENDATESDTDEIEETLDDELDIIGQLKKTNQEDDEDLW